LYPRNYRFIDITVVNYAAVCADLNLTRMEDVVLL